MNMNKFLVWLLLPYFLTVEAHATANFTLPRIQVVPIKDSQSDRQYELYIKLPEGYSKNTDKTYPIIYFTDAMWHIEILSGSVDFILADTILVGISWQIVKDKEEPHGSRYRDYTVTKSKNSNIQRGQAASHLAFIRNDVIEYIESHYRANPKERSYFGYSLGGVFGSYVLLAEPDTFKNYILGSPAFGKGISYFSKFETKTAQKRKDLKANVLISYGSLEKEKSRGGEAFIAMIKRRNYPSLLIEKSVIESADHGSAFPKTAIRSLYWLSDLNKK